MTDMLLDIASIATNIAFWIFMGAGIHAAIKGTVAQLIKACQRYWTGVALATLVLIINLASVPFDGWFSPVINAFTVIMAVTTALLTDQRRERKVIEEMQRDLGRES